MQENLVTNYSGLADLYEEKGNLSLALSFLVKHYELRDSVISQKSQTQIAEMEAKYGSQQKEISLQKSQSALIRARHNLVKVGSISFFLLLMLAFGIWKWRKQTIENNREKENNEENLYKLTQMLLKKNTLLLELEEQLTQKPTESVKPVSPQQFEKDVFNQKILTDEDWAAFKLYFEKIHPGYLLRLRKNSPTISEAEERLALFLKINLTRKEAAAILGISAESVKKTRQRLRKRLAISEETDLEEYLARL